MLRQLKTGSILFIVLFTATSYAQVTPCGFHWATKHIHEHDSEAAARMHEILSRDDLSSRSPVSEDVYTVKVVVHDVFQDTAAMFSDSMIEAVVASVTADFRHQNSDSAWIRPIFADVVGDTKIEFEVADIFHIHTDTTFGFDFFTGLPDHVKRTEAGGHDAVDPEHYLNVWICQLDGGLLGYAYPPEGLPHWPDGSAASSAELDGVVIHNEAFALQGTINLNGETMAVRGRTITHEFGHYLGLRHIWGDGLSILGIPACDEDDGVEDTPNQGFQTAFNCDTTLNTCMDSDTTDLPDMIENHMDYTSEDCKTAFTNGQSMIMRGVLENERNGLIQSMSHTQNFVMSNENSPLFIYPNPNDGTGVYLKSEGQSDHVQCRIVNLAGKLIYQNDIQLNTDKSTFINLHHLANGTYIIHLSASAYRSSAKLVVVK